MLVWTLSLCVRTYLRQVLRSQCALIEGELLLFKENFFSDFKTCTVLTSISFWQWILQLFLHWSYLVYQMVIWRRTSSACLDTFTMREYMSPPSTKKWICNCWGGAFVVQRELFLISKTCISLFWWKMVEIFISGGAKESTTHFFYKIQNSSWITTTSLHDVLIELSRTSKWFFWVIYYIFL